FFAEKKSILRFAEKNSGNCAYFSVKGGFEIEKWLESASTNLKAEIGGFGGRALQKGDRLIFNQGTKDKGQRTNIKISHTLIPFYSRFPTVRIIAGAEFKSLTT